MEPLSQKDSCYIVCRGSDSKLRTSFTPELNGRGCEIAVVGLSTYYSYPNVNEKNNVVWVIHDFERQKIELPKGCYEVEDIHKVIRKAFGWAEEKEKVKLEADPVTLRVHMKLAKDWQVYFPPENSIAGILGFKVHQYYVGPKEFISQRIANILSVNSILVQCDIISGSSINGRPAPVIFNYSPDVDAGSKIVAEPVTPIYLPVTLDRINELNVWVTDQDNRLLDLQDEDLVVTFHMRTR